MLQSSFEVLTGVIDGVNVVFTSSTEYEPGTTAVFLNGQLKRPHVSGVQDGWTETDPAGGVVTLDEAPRPGDVVQMYFLHDVPAPAPTVVVEGIEATIADVDALSAVVDDADVVDAVVADVQEFEATLEAT